MKVLLKNILVQKPACGLCTKPLQINLKPLNFRCLSCEKPSPVDAVETFFDSAYRLEGQDTISPTMEGSEETLSISQMASNAIRTGESMSIGKYKVIEKLGQGGMGIVYRVFESDLQKEYALKLLSDDQVVSEEQIERFKNEAKIAASLSHPNIVGIRDFDQHGGRWYYCMDLVEGKPFDQWSEQHSLEENLEVLVKILDALSYAHKNSVVHRDLKPDNILVTPEGNPKVLDFGIAKDRSKVSHLTKTASILGTPNYVSPEQAQGSKFIDGRSDVFSMGIVLYQLLTKRLPFEADTPMVTMLMIMEQDPTPPCKVRAAVPRDLETICLKALEKQRRERYKMSEFADDIRRYLKEETIQARPLSSSKKLFRRLKKHQKTVAIFTFVLLALFLSLFLWIQARKESFSLRDKQKLQKLWIQAKTLENEGKYEEALSITEPLIKLEKDLGEFYWFRGRLYQKQANFFKAHQDFQKLLKNEKFRDQGNYGLAQSNFLMQRFQDALNHLKSVKDTSQFDEFQKLYFKVCVALIQEHGKKGQLEEMHGVLSKSLQYVKSGKEHAELSKQKAHIEQILDPQEPQDFFALFDFLRARKTKKVQQRLITSISLFLRKFPQHQTAKECKEELGALCLELGLYKKAAEAFRALISLHPDYPEYWKKLALCYRALENTVQERECKLKLLQAYKSYSEKLLQQKDSKPEGMSYVIQYLKAYLAAYPEEERERYKLVVTLINYSNYLAEKKFELEQALRLNREAQQILKNSSWGKYKQPKELAMLGKQIRRSERNYAGALHPKTARDYALRATLKYRVSQNPIEAIELLSKALKIDPNDLLSLNNRAGHYVRTGQPYKALEDLEEGIAS